MIAHDSRSSRRVSVGPPRGFSAERRRPRWTLAVALGGIGIAFAACNGESPKGAPASTGAPATVRVHYPVGAHALTITGDHAPLTDVRPLTQRDDDTWELVVPAFDAPLALTLTLDGTQARGPAYKIAPGQTIDIYPHFFTKSGTSSYFIEDFASTNLPGTKRNIRMYQPPSYAENTAARFPVLYMFDGQILFDASLSKFDDAAKLLQSCWNIDKAFDDAAESGTFPEAIVIGVDLDIGDPDNVDINGIFAQRLRELTPTKDDAAAGTTGTGGGENTLKMIVSELKPRVDTELRTLPDRANTYIAGASLGGLMSTWAGVEYGNVFGQIGNFSGSNWWANELDVQKVREAKIGPDRAIKAYVDVGAHEAGTDQGDASVPDGGMTVAEGNAKMIDGYEHVVQAYRDAGYIEGQTLMAVLDPEGTHSATYWSKRFPNAAAFLFGPGR